MNAAQAEVVKESVSSDGFTGAELATVKGKIQTQSGVDATVTKLYTGEVTIDDQTATVKTGNEINATYLDQGNDTDGYPNRKPELSAVTMTIDGKTITAVLNGQIYIQK